MNKNLINTNLINIPLLNKFSVLENRPSNIDHTNEKTVDLKVDKNVQNQDTRKKKRVVIVGDSHARKCEGKFETGVRSDRLYQPWCINRRNNKFSKIKNQRAV